MNEAPARRAASVDPIQVSVIQGALENIAIEMGYKLMRMSHSSIIRESEDFGAAIIDEQARQLCEAKQSTPLQSGPIPGYIRGIRRQLAERGDVVRPGDVLIHNDPYAGASHGPDVAFVVPAFLGEELVGYAVTTAHHLDIGAHTPGSGGIVDAIDSYAEGVQFRSIKVYEEGVANKQVWQMIRDNIRMSDVVVGDMEAQVAAARIGAARYLEVIERYGLAEFRAAAAAMLDNSERLMRRAIADVPDGDYSATTYVDGFLDDDDPSRRELPIAVTVKVRGDEMTVDLDGTAPQVPDRPINMPFEGTTDCAIWLAIRSVLLDTAVHGEIPHNSGLIRPIKIVAPAGSLANPIFPAPVIARYVQGIQLADSVVKALSQVVPTQTCAGVGNGGGMIFGGNDDAGDLWIHVELFEGSYGGRYGRDGMDAVDVLYANTRNNPIEDIESHVPLRIDRYELRDDACAAGRWRGGIGTIKEFSYLSGGSSSLESDGAGFAPWGFDGGGEGRTRRMWFEKKGGERRDLPSKFSFLTYAAEPGDRFVAVGPCGGGYGDPFERDPAQVLEDVLDGYVSVERARNEFGVVLTPGMTVDERATARMRSA